MPARALRILSAASADTPDAELLGRFVATRDESAFADLVRRHGPAVLRVCRRLAGPASADDAFQAVFLVLACRAKSVRKAGSVGSWLIGVAGRVARQMRRSARRQETGDSRAASTAGSVYPLSPDSCLLTQELAAVFDDELTRLPDGLRGPVVLCYLHGRTHEQAAADLGGSVRTLRRRLDRAKAVLRARLERRGVVPAVAAALVAGVGPAAAVPPELARRAVEGVFEFLAGGGRGSPAAVVAKGVVGNMVKLKASLLMVAAATVLTGLGVVWADDPARPAYPPTPVQPLPPPGLGPTPLGVDFAFPLARPVPAVSHRTANFVVYAASPVVARAVAAEAEFQRKEVARRLLGKELPDWPAPCEVRVLLDDPNRGSATVMEYGKDEAGKPTVKVARMELRGPFLAVLTDLTPHEVTHTVLASFLKKPLPRWADEGIASLAESAGEQFIHEVRCRELLNAGRGIRLRTLFRMTEFPQDTMVLYAQGQSVCRFLLSRTGPGLPVLSDIPYIGRLFQAGPEYAEQRLLAFVALGTDGNTAETWDKAAKQIYGFESVDALEEAWLDSLKTPPARPRPKPPEQTKPDLIPPANLPGAKPQAKRSAADTVAISSRTVKLTYRLGQGRRELVEQVQLFVSRDEGDTWEQATTADPGKDELVYTAPRDGLYWFHMVTVGKNGAREPRDFTREPPAMKVLVDTTPPTVRVTTAKREVDMIRVEWAVEDANPGPVEVWTRRPGADPIGWVRRASAESWATAATFSPGHAGPVEVRVTAKDAAGNEGVSAVVRVE